MGLNEGFPVKLPSKTPETGRSLRSGKSETGPCTSPDGSFFPIRAGESTDTLKKEVVILPHRRRGKIPPGLVPADSPYPVQVPGEGCFKKGFSGRGHADGGVED